jgi:hypothetical protein
MLRRREGNVILVVGIVLLVLWLVGLGSSYTLGGFIYVALLLGLILVIVSLITRFRGPR